jgi:hypothetical protein
VNLEDDDTLTALGREPIYPQGTPEYAAYAKELREELAKFAACQPPYDYWKNEPNGT